MEYKDINEDVKTLSPEEREEHKGLIEECRKREKENDERRNGPDAAHKKLNEFADTMGKNIEIIEGTYKTVYNTNSNAKNALENMGGTTKSMGEIESKIQNSIKNSKITTDYLTKQQQRDENLYKVEKESKKYTH